MKPSGVIFKSISDFFIAIMLYMHVCSAWCALSGYGCCNKDNDDCKTSCCSKKESDNNKDGDCQTLHFSFFNTTGQFASGKSVDAVKAFAGLVAIIHPVLNLFQTSQYKNAFAYNLFHPPPLKEDIRILIQSFQF